jgi:hypothetical protein
VEVTAAHIIAYYFTQKPSHYRYYVFPTEEFMGSIISVCADLTLTVFNPSLHSFLITVLGRKTASKMDTVIL